MRFSAEETTPLRGPDRKNPMAVTVALYCVRINRTKFLIYEVEKENTFDSKVSSTGRSSAP